MSDFTDNPNLYRSLCEPHDSVEKVNAEVRAFWEGVGALREKHRIPDVVCVVRVHALDEGEEKVATVAAHWGDYRSHEYMLAYEAGKMAGDRQKELARLMRAEAIMEGVRR